MPHPCLPRSTRTTPDTWTARYVRTLRSGAEPVYMHPVHAEIDDVCETLGDAHVLDVVNDASYDVVALLSGDRVACIRPDADLNPRWAVYALCA